MIDVPFHNGKIMKSIKTIKPVLEADKIINIPKIKTHMMTVYSGAVKNFFGIIPGSYKAEYHLKFENKMDFADLLIDICSFSKPVLTVMDAVVGMEGYGPTAGNPKKVGLVLASVNPYELDDVAARIIGLKPTEVPTIIKSRERGLLGDEICIAGPPIEEVLVKDFKKPTRQYEFNFYNILLPKFLRKRLERFIKPRPVFKTKQCKSCGACLRSCPPGAIKMENGKPVVKLDQCIRCFCCHELCNYEAIKIKKPWFLKLLLH
jgi:ferredoxin